MTPSFCIRHLIQPITNQSSDQIISKFTDHKIICPSELLAVGQVNEAVIRGDSQQLLSTLLLPSCGVEEVLPANTCRYLSLLTRARQHKAQVNPHSDPSWVDSSIYTKNSHWNLEQSSDVFIFIFILKSHGCPLSNQVSRDLGAELWLADIQEAVRRANQESQRALKCEFSVKLKDLKLIFN